MSSICFYRRNQRRKTVQQTDPVWRADLDSGYMQIEYMYIVSREPKLKSQRA